MLWLQLMLLASHQLYAQALLRWPRAMLTAHVQQLHQQWCMLQALCQGTTVLVQNDAWVGCKPAALYSH
jgi:hypothetical protein